MEPRISMIAPGVRALGVAVAFDEQGLQRILQGSRWLPLGDRS